MKLDDIKESGDPKKSSTGGSVKKTDTGTVHKAGDNYSGKSAPRSIYNDGKQSSKISLPDGGKGKHFNEATGDAKFDGMMGKIAGNTEPVTPPSAAGDRVQDADQNGPDMETINALNKMMYDMHTTMQTANQLMQKLMRGR
jgi:hypothetical protein